MTPELPRRISESLLVRSTADCTVSPSSVAERSSKPVRTILPIGSCVVRGEDPDDPRRISRPRAVTSMRSLTVTNPSLSTVAVTSKRWISLLPRGGAALLFSGSGSGTMAVGAGRERTIPFSQAANTSNPSPGTRGSGSPERAVRKRRSKSLPFSPPVSREADPVPDGFAVGQNWLITSARSMGEAHLSPVTSQRT